MTARAAHGFEGENMGATHGPIECGSDTWANRNFAIQNVQRACTCEADEALRVRERGELGDLIKEVGRGDSRCDKQGRAMAYN